MQFILDLVAAAVIWIAAMAFAHFGVKIDVPHQTPPKHERSIERTDATPAPTPAVSDCPQMTKAVVRHA